jgi:hypothetical protein
MSGPAAQLPFLLLTISRSRQLKSPFRTLFLLAFSKQSRLLSAVRSSSSSARLPNPRDGDG